MMDFYGWFKYFSDSISTVSTAEQSFDYEKEMYDCILAQWGCTSSRKSGYADNHDLRRWEWNGELVFTLFYLFASFYFLFTYDFFYFILLLQVLLW